MAWQAEPQGRVLARRMPRSNVNELLPDLSNPGKSGRCTGKSARSPIAEALLRHHTGGQAEVASAGSRPKPHLHPKAVRTLLDGFGINLGGQRPRHVDTMSAV